MNYGIAHHHTQFIQILLFEQLSQLVCKEVDREPGDDDQASVISYFIHTAKVFICISLTHLHVRIFLLYLVSLWLSLCPQSCLDLKNFEAVFAIMKGLQSKTVQQAQASWQVSPACCAMHHYHRFLLSILQHCMQQAVRSSLETRPIL